MFLERALPDSGGKMHTPNKDIPSLIVKGTKLTDSTGKTVVLRGISTHGIERYPEYINEESFKTFRDEWGANIIRLAMYTGEPGGYCEDGNKEEQKEIMRRGIELATKLGMYVIVDWHILVDNDPRQNKDEAILFFDEFAKDYADYTNVIYEICNEPQQSPWEEVIRPYAEEIISVIRKYSKDSLIIVGTNSWSQDVDDVIGKKCTDSNCMYAVHYYAATHKQKLRDKAAKAMEGGVPVFISECSICDASGNGEVDYESAEEWLAFEDKYELSYCVWNLSNKDESSAFIIPTCSKLSHWNDDELSDTAKWFKKKMSSK